MTRTLDYEAARAQWRIVMDMVTNGDTVIIEENGKPIVAVIPHEMYLAAQERRVAPLTPNYDDLKLRDLAFAKVLRGGDPVEAAIEAEIGASELKDVASE